MIELLSALCAAPGVSGDESAAAAVSSRLLSTLGEVSVTPLGSVLCFVPPKKEGLPRVLLTAHIDQIGLMVTRVADSGFVRVAPCGGLDRRGLAGARVTVHAASGPIKGVICAVPPHLSEGKATSPKPEDAAVDLGLSAESARARVRCGDRITLDGALTPLLGDRVMAAALDNRAGCAAVIRAAELLRDCGSAEIAVALVTQEEVGSAGAATAAFFTAPDFAFAVDVSMGMTPDDRPELCAEMGRGPMIGFAPILDRRMSQSLVDTARREGIPFQLEVMAKTGTDADAVAVSRLGVRTALVSIPLRYMHTPGEVAALCDIQNAARLLAAEIGGGLC